MAPVRRHRGATRRAREDGTADAPFRVESTPPASDDDDDDYDDYSVSAPTPMVASKFKTRTKTNTSRSRRRPSRPTVAVTASQSPSPTVYSDSSLTVSTVAVADCDTSYGAKAKGTTLPEPIIVCGVELQPTVAFDTFWRFAAERKAIDDRRRAGQSPPFTEDKILRDYFFCNTYRVLDKLSQYLIKEVIEKGSQDPEEVVFRVLLFNSFTRIETWELLDRELGPLTWATYDRDAYMVVLAAASESGAKLYTGAFIKPAPHFGYAHNYANHLCLLEAFMINQLHARLRAAPYLANVYEYIIAFPSMGAFSTYQLILSLSYTKVLNFHPGDLVVSGPGSESGLNKLFGARAMARGRAQMGDEFEAEVIRYLAASQAYHFQRLGLEFSGLGPKRLPMTVVDIEHTLCEVDKYCRVAHPQLKGKRTNLHRTFRPSSVGAEGADAGRSWALPKAVLPKAWADPRRRTSRIREDRTLHVEKRYEIESLRDHREAPNGQERQFLVYWVGYPPSEATWEFESSLAHDAPLVVAQYRQAHGLPKRVDAPDA
ncbi:hypothetical protein JR316_0010997 [Psilocybe cubensis]|uniref:Chromo domain-containing protein n=2 Tax=Psilocybe cubensis TaxID=181762 RepID=A0A8H7XMN5_PSICU|nr:hypothetical protein JR316_0010997 [Psilocybe cubensis]KAH9477081.1 hypothetical protein JR316_0010997 [Psilocybe cubensis]